MNHIDINTLRAPYFIPKTRIALEEIRTRINVRVDYAIDKWVEAIRSAIKNILSHSSK